MQIYFCGFMGSGKTHYAKNMAARLNLRFVDLDAFIEKNSGMSISGIFLKYGEKYFRELEYSALLRTEDYDLISTGGGILTSDNCYEFLKEKTVIFTDTDFETCYERIRWDPDRPLTVNNSKEELFQLYSGRLERYNAVADYTANNDEEIMKIIQNLKG